MSSLLFEETIHKIKLLPLVEPTALLRRIKVKVKNDWRKDNWVEKRLLVNHDYRFIYCPMYKVASSSMMAALLALSNSNKKDKLLQGSRLNIRIYVELNYSLASYPYSEAKQFLDGNYFKFVIVRNPWEKLVSTYCNFVVNLLPNGEPTGISREATHAAYGEEDYSKYRDTVTFRQFITDYICGTDDENINVHCISQTRFLGNIQYDFIGRQENLVEDLGYIKNKLDLPLELPKLNTTRYEAFNFVHDQCFADFSPQALRQMAGGLPKYQQFYTPELIERVRQRYRKDVDVLLYDFQ